MTRSRTTLLIKKNFESSIPINHLLNTLISQAAEEWSEFVLMIREVTNIITITTIIITTTIIIICMKYWVKTKNVQVMVRDSGDYECQVSGPNHTSISKLVSLTVIGETIVGWMNISG